MTVKKQVFKKGSAESYVINDADLMEFLSTEGTILFEISSDEWSKYMLTGDTIVEFMDKRKETQIHPKKTSIEKIRQDIKRKQIELRNMRQKYESVSVELDKVTAFILDLINKNEEIESKTAHHTDMKRKLMNELEITIEGKEESRRSIETIQHEIKIRKDDLERMQNMIERSEEERDELRNRDKIIHSELEELINILRKKEKLIDEFDNRQRSIRKEITVNEEEKERWIRVLNKNLSELSTMKKRKLALEKEVILYAKNIDTVKVILAKLKNKLKKLQSVVIS